MTGVQTCALPISSANGCDEAFWRRVHVLPFNETFEGERQDKNRGEMLLEELPGILSWAVRGCLEWQRIGLNPPDLVKVASKAYRAENDVVAGFIEDKCKFGAGMACSASEIWRAFQAYCQDIGELPVSQKALGMRLTKSGCKSERTRVGKRWRGISITNYVEAQDELENCL